LTPLNARQAASCENAKSPASACKCRCGGAKHGLGRGAVRSLDASDPHHPDDEDPKARKRREREEASVARMRALIAAYRPVEGDDR
jgi:hypothetical protein